MIQTALDFLLNTILNLLTFLLLLRFFMQWLKVSFQNPLAQMTIAFTDFIVKPARKFIPSLGKLDLSTLLLALLVQVALICLLVLLKDFSSFSSNLNWVGILLLACIKVIKLSLEMFFYALLLQAILSWVNPNTPISHLLNTLTRPILAPIQKIIPPVNGFDLSALVAMILLQMVNISVISSIESHLNSIF